MENQRFSVIHPEEIFSQTKEQQLEVDILLPDYYPEISKILDCGISLSEEAVTLTSDKISISGAAFVTLMYTSAENELRIYETVTKYTKLIDGGNFAADDVCIVDQTVESVNYRAVSPRKMELRGAAAVRVDVFRKTETECLSEIADERIQTRQASCDVFQLHSFYAKKIEITDVIGLPETNKSIRSIFNANAKVVLNETKAINNKVMLNGSMEVSFMYISVDNNVSGTHTVSLPFSKIVDVIGVRENDITHVFIKQTQAWIEFDKNDAAASKADAKIEAQLVFVAGANLKAAYIDDVYAINGDVQTNRSNVRLYNGAAIHSVYPKIEGELQIYDVAGGEIAEKTVKDITCSISVNAGKVDITGSFRLNVLLKTKDGQYACVSRNCLYSDQFEIKEPGWLCFAAASPGSLSAEIAEDCTLKFKGNLIVNLLRLNGNETQVVSDVVFSESGRDEDRKKIVLYYGMKGENLWNIAKENKTAVSAVREVNALETDVLEEDRLLVFWD